MQTIKRLITVGCLCVGMLLLSNPNASAQSFVEGDMVINGGIGLGTTYSWGAGLGLPFGGGLEYGITNLETGAIGIGGTVGYVGGTGLSILYIGGKGSYHYPLENNEDWDLYGGLSLLYRNFNWGSNFISANTSGVTVGFHLGARYYFSDNVGIYAELGNNWAWLNAGVAFKL